MGITTRLPAAPLAPGPACPPEQPPEEITHGLFGLGRRLTRTHPLASDALLAAVLLGLCSAWLSWSAWASYRAAIVQTALIAALIFRRLHPSAVFLATSAIAFAQWLLGFPLLGDAALLIALYTVAAHESRIRALLATVLLGVGSVMAAVKWQLAGTVPRSLLFLFAMVVAALFAGLTAASGSRYLAWMDERARRLEIERDQQAVIAAAAERTRIARELHDIVSHSLSVVITLADASAVVGRSDPARGVEAMTEASEVARRALTDMRAMLGVLRTDELPAGFAPQPGIEDLGALADFDLDEYAFGALRAGASGFLLKDVRPGELVAAIRTVAAGDAVVSPRVTRRLLEEYARVLPLAPGQRERQYPQLATLTEREREVLVAVARGLSNTEIAALLFVSEATVKSHVGRILAKLSLRDRVQVVVLAYEAGLIQPGVR